MAPRPQVLSYVLVPLTALMLERDRWWLAVAAYLLGINLHGGLYPLYMVVAAYYLLPTRPWVLAVFFAATVANPQTWELYIYPFKALLHVSAAPVEEWTPVTLQNYPALFLALFAATIVAARPGVPFALRLLCLAFGALSLVAMRHAVWFFLIPLPMLAPYFEALGSARTFPLDRVPAVDRLASRMTREWVDWLKSRAAARAGRGHEASAAKVTPQTGRRLNLMLALSLLLFAAAIVAAAEPLDVDRTYPRQAADFLKARGDTRFYNLWNHGGYLIFQGLPPFIDGRQDPFEIRSNGRYDLIGDHVRTIYLRSDIEPVLQRYAIKTILMSRDTALVRVLQTRPAFRTVYTDPEFVVLDYVPLAP
jgi:hypothetical protein